ncbi:unnamed protein product [Arctogadus glacialis]
MRTSTKHGGVLPAAYAQPGATSHRQSPSTCAADNPDLAPSNTFPIHLYSESGAGERDCVFAVSSQFVQPV